MRDRIRTFEDYELGQSGVSNTRTVTEADIVNFGCLTIDYSLPHMDRHSMEGSMYGARVAHGLLGSSLVTGMLSLTAPHVLGRGVPGAYFLGFDANYRDAIKLDDTVSIRWRVAEKKEETLYPGYGLVATAFEVVTQQDRAVYDGTLSTLVGKDGADNAPLSLTGPDPWKVEPFVPGAGKEYAVEDYPVGSGGQSEGRTITETDVVTFAGLTGDYNPLHVDAHYAGTTAFGQRIAHGMLVFTIAFGLWISHRSAHNLRPAGSTNGMVAGHLNDRSTFVAPVAIGDTIRCLYKTLGARPSKSKPGIGLIGTGFQVVNQRDEVVQEGSTLMMGPSRRT